MAVGSRRSGIRSWLTSLRRPGRRRSGTVSAGTLDCAGVPSSGESAIKMPLSRVSPANTGRSRPPRKMRELSSRNFLLLR